MRRCLWGPRGGLAAAGAAAHACPADPLEALPRAAPASRHSGVTAREHWTGNSQQLKPVVRVRCGRDYWCNLAAGGIVCLELHAAVRCRGPGRWQFRCVSNAVWCCVFQEAVRDCGQKKFQVTLVGVQGGACMRRRIISTTPHASHSRAHWA